MPGVRQGDLLSSLLFAMTWQTVVRQAMTEFQDKGVKILSFQDDATIVAPIDLVFNVYDRIIAAADSVASLVVQPTKCAFIYLHAETTPPAPETSRRISSGEIPSLNALEILGAPVGQFGSGYDAIMQERLNRNSAVFDRLQRPAMKVQVASTLLRVCVQRQFDYMLRMIRPTAVMPFAKKFDAELFAVVRRLLRLPTNAEDDPTFALTFDQMLLPIAAGGLGHRTADTSPTAFLAAHVGVVRDDPESWNAIDTEYPNSSSDLMNIMTQCAIEVRKQCLAGRDNDVEAA